MDHEIFARISKEWGIDQKTINQHVSYFEDIVKPLIKKNFLSHLVTTIEDMVNNKRTAAVLNQFKDDSVLDREKLRGFLATKTFRLYSITLEPVNLKRRATTRYHPSGAIIYYNSCFDEKTIRILIAHEIGHIVNKELIGPKEDSEQTANLFAYIAIEDKNKFYKKGSEPYTYASDIQIFNDIQKNCPT